MNLRHRKSRGQAAVELALMTVLIIPVFLYILFIDDLLRFKQDQQETVITSTWDMSVLNYDSQIKNSKMYFPSLGSIPKAPGTMAPGYTPPATTGMAARVAGYDRLTFSDHTVASPRFDNPAANVSADANEEKHHLGVGAHECWLAPGAQQVQCKESNVDQTANFTVDGTPNARTRVKSSALNGYGGLSECSAQVGVLNHWLPSGVLFFSKEELSSRTYHGVNSSAAIDYEGGGVHGAALGSGSVYLFPLDTFSMITNPWAMANSDGLNPPGDNGHSGPLYDRVDAVYGSTLTYAALLYSESQYPVAAALSEKILNPLTLIDYQFGDLILTPEVAFTPDFAPTADGFFASQWQDWGGNHVQKSYQARGKWYLGSKSKP